MPRWPGLGKTQNYCSPLCFLDFLWCCCKLQILKSASHNGCGVLPGGTVVLHGRLEGTEDPIFYLELMLMLHISYNGCETGAKLSQAFKRQNSPSLRWERASTVLKIYQILPSFIYLLNPGLFISNRVSCSPGLLPT